MNKNYMFGVRERTASGTSFHGTTVNLTLEQLIQVLGPDFRSTDKTTHDWVCQNHDGEIFTVYNWKSGMPAYNEVVVWNIGGYSKESTEKAKIELVDAALNLPLGT